MKNIFAVAGIVIKELYRRKDFYVLFILTVLICLVMASVNIFNDKQIVRYLKELCLLLIWISSLVIAVSTMARQLYVEKESRPIFPLLAKPGCRDGKIRRGGIVQMQRIEAVAAFVRRTRPYEAMLGQRGRHGAADGSPARMQTLGPRAVLQELKAA